MLKDEVWTKVHSSSFGMLCILHVEQRLGRRLTKVDFNDSHVNKHFPGKSFSQRLMERLSC